jgi:hypothetical protein
MSEKEFSDALSVLLNDHYETLLAKNSNYGDNLLYFGLRGVLMRLHDKYKRLETLVMKNEKDKVGESVADTLRDLSGYCLVCLAHIEMGDMTINGTWEQPGALSTWEKNS